LPGVWVTSAGYAGGITPNPTYEEVCSGRTGHTEVVQVVFDPKVISYGDLLKAFWENHDPTQGMRQGNDQGTQYRSAIYTLNEAQQAEAEASRDAYQAALTAAGKGTITTEIEPAGPYYFAEDYHQGYLAENPAGDRGIGGTGVACPIGRGGRGGWTGRGSARRVWRCGGRRWTIRLATMSTSTRSAARCSSWRGPRAACRSRSRTSPTRC